MLCSLLSGTAQLLLSDTSFALKVLECILNGRILSMFLGVLVADWIGICLYMQLAFLMLPITKNSIWFVLFGISFERAVKYHRWMALVVQ